MTALTDGLHASLYALAWLVGALLPYLALTCVVLSAVPLYRGARRRLTPHQLHRAARRSGRINTAPHHATQALAQHQRTRVLDGTEHTHPRND